MLRTALLGELRGRPPWGWLPVVALVSAAATFAVHHSLPVEAHTAPVTVAVVAVAVALSVTVVLLSRPVDRTLPLVVTALPERIAVAPTSRADLGVCAALHSDALEHGFLVSLGHGFMRAYHAAYVASPHAVSLVATAGAVPIGMVVGTVDAHAHRRWVLRHRGLRLAARAATALAARPVTALRFARTRLGRYRNAWKRERAEAAPRRPRATVSTLDHLAVLEGARGAGAGERLTTAFVAELRARGARRVELVTRADEHGAARFYRRLGWRASETSPAGDGPAMQHMVLDPETT